MSDEHDLDAPHDDLALGLPPEDVLTGGPSAEELAVALHDSDSMAVVEPVQISHSISAIGERVHLELAQKINRVTMKRFARGDFRTCQAVIRNPVDLRELFEHIGAGVIDQCRRRPQRVLDRAEHVRRDDGSLGMRNQNHPVQVLLL